MRMQREFNETDYKKGDYFDMPKIGKKDAIAKICGFAARKDHYPYQWPDLDNSIFPASRTVVVDTMSGGKDRIIIGRNIVHAVNGLMDGSIFWSMTAGGDIVVECRRTSAPSVYNAAVMYAEDTSVSGVPRGTVAAATVDFSSGTPEWRPYELENDSGKVMAVLGLLIQANSCDDTEPPLYLLRALSKAGFVPDCPATVLKDHVSVIARIAFSFYRDGLQSESSPLRFLLEDIPVLRPAEASRLASAVKPAKCREHMTFRSPKVISPVIFNMGGLGKIPDIPVDDEAEKKHAEVKKADASELETLQKELALDIHPLESEEKKMVAKLGTSYVVDENLKRVAKMIKRDWHSDVDLAPNIILEGDAGSGKTAGTKFFSCVWGIPRTKMTMSPTMESSNLIGAFFPVFNDVTEWDVNDEDRNALKALEKHLMSGCVPGSDVPPKKGDLEKTMRIALSEKNARDVICRAYGLPSLEEALIDADSAWKRLGNDSPTPSIEDVVEQTTTAANTAVGRLINIICENEVAGNVSYKFIYSELMKAFERGWLCEIQEASSIMRPGVLTELNSLLEKNGRIELPNGKYIYRHPDTIIVFTTNRDYCGNYELNESLRDRCIVGLGMDKPTPDVMAARAMAQTGFDNPVVARAAAEIVSMVSDEAAAKGIRGNFGMRSLLAWMRDLADGDFSVETFSLRVIQKMTTRPDERVILEEIFQNNFRATSR